jgi:hemoglobin-like flavoprotein
MLSVCSFMYDSSAGSMLSSQGKLKQDSPGAERLFRCDMESQSEMLSHMLQFLVYAMSRPETLRLGLRDLGRRHDGYGVASEYYPSFRQAFLESARVVLGEKHTPQVEKAWADTIDMIIESMLGPLPAQSSRQTFEP